jgi:hypothetical protein
MMQYQDYLPRLAAHQDVPRLKALWKTVFCDSDADIDYFFNTYFSPERTVVIDDGTKPVSAAYILPTGDLVLPDGTRLSCAMLYAIATHPECRGSGYGEAVTRAAGRLASQTGFPAAVLKPAEDGLFAFYEKRSEFREFFTAFEARFTAAELPPSGSLYAIAPVFPSEYRRLRQRFLKGCAYIDMDERGLAYQQYLSEKAGGGLYALRFADDICGCAVIESGDHSVIFKELLLSGRHRMLDAVSAAAQLLPADLYTVIAVSGYEKPEKTAFQRFGMLMPIPGREEIFGTSSVQCAKWYGLAFD